MQQISDSPKPIKLGRPLSPDSQSPAARQAARRLRMKELGKTTVTIELSADLFAALDKFMQFKTITKSQVIEAALRDRFMRKR